MLSVSLRYIHLCTVECLLTKSKNLTNTHFVLKEIKDLDTNLRQYSPAVVVFATFSC